jgi:hypothetical protein
MKLDERIAIGPPFLKNATLILYFCVFDAAVLWVWTSIIHRVTYDVLLIEKNHYTPNSALAVTRNTGTFTPEEPSVISWGLGMTR